MPFIDTKFEGLKIYEPRVFEDHRGYFCETYNANTFKQEGNIDMQFVQDNVSKSMRGVFRGMHYQTGEFAQAKLVRVLKGSVLDVVVDLRKNQPTFGQSFSIELTEENRKQFLIPRGFAHGFLVLEDNTEFFYKCDNFYSKDHEAGLSFMDKSLGINLPISMEELILSDKDKAQPNLENAIIFE